MYSLAVSIKKESIRVIVPFGAGEGTATMTGKDKWTRIHVLGTEGVKYAADPPVSFGCGDGGATLYWGIIEGSGRIYNNRRIVLTRDGAALNAAFYLQGATEPLFTTVLEADKPVQFTLYNYSGELRVRKE